jgi:hypothetical protein
MVSEQSLQHWALNRATLELWQHIYIFLTDAKLTKLLCTNKKFIFVSC